MHSVRSRVVSETVDVPADVVYEFARVVENLPLWASGLAAGVTQVDGEWFAASPMGRVRIEMVARNEFRVLDHDVTLPDGTVGHNAFRVTPVGEGSLLTFVVLRSPGAGDDAFDKDAMLVAHDLRTLKTLLETGAANSMS